MKNSTLQLAQLTAVQGKITLIIVAALALAAFMPVYSIWQEAVYQQDEYLLGLGFDSLVMLPLMIMACLHSFLYWYLYRCMQQQRAGRWVLYVLASSLLLYAVWLTVYLLNPSNSVANALISLFVVITALCELVMGRHLLRIDGFRGFAWLTLFVGISRLGFLVKGLVSLWPGLVLSLLPGLCLFLSFNALAMSFHHLRAMDKK